MSAAGPSGHDPASLASIAQGAVEPAAAPADAARWWLDPGLAKLAFGSRVAPAAAAGDADTIHLAFLPIESLELDLSDPAQRDFGDYELLEQVGQGGMGVVYRARQKSLEREVALKLLSAGPWASEEFIAGFRREARNAASLQHPNIVAVFEMGEQDGLIFYAMQLIRGQSLAQRLQAQGRMPPREAAALLRTVAEAVDYAHRLGVLHLDLKPGNILLDEHGVAQVTDFGLARRLGQAPSVENEQISGTPSYMAPEQAQVRNARLSAATDIWGIGAVLYETLTGTPPFTGDSPQQILQLVIAGSVRDPDRYADIPRDLHAICLKCLAKPQAGRYASARELADDLGRFLENRSVQARPLNAAQRLARWARREPKFATASAAAVLALVAGLAATTQQWRRAEDNAASASERLWQGRRGAALRLEADGEGWQALPQLLQNVREQTAAGRDEGALRDRQRIGLLLSQGATLIDTIAIADASPLAVALSEDGSRLAIALSDQSVRWYDTATLAERGRISLRGRITSGGQARSITLLRFVGNDRVRATFEWYRSFVSPADTDTWLLDLSHNAVLEPPDAFAAFSDAAYAGDGRLALLRDRERRVQLWQTSPWTPLSAKLATQPAQAEALPWLVAPDSRHALALGDAMQTLHVYALPGLRRDRSHALPQDAGASAWSVSPDGRHLALGDVNGRVFLFALETGALRALPSARGREISWLAFDADGTWLAAAGVDGRVQAFAVDSGDALVSGGMDAGFAVRRVGIDRDRRLLIASGQGRTAAWRLPAASGPRALPAIRIGAAPATHALAGPYAIDWSMRSGLLASAGVDGQVRLWRLPASPTSSATMPSQLPESAHFDGRHIVDVAWNRLRIVAGNDTGIGPWLALAQPPGFAELVGDGSTLVVSVGPQLRIYDAPSLRLRAAPIDLPASPQRLLASNDGRLALLAFAAHGPTGFEERLQLYDLVAGQRLPAETILQGPLLALKFAADARRIVAVGNAEATTTVLAAPSLQTIGDYPHDPFQPVVAADFTLDGRDVLLVTRAEDPRLGSDALLRWDPVDDRILSTQPTGGARPYGVIALAHGAFLPGEVHHLVVDGVAARRIPRSASAFDSSMGAYAGSADRRRVALASLRGVQIYTDDGEPLGGTLWIDTPTQDGIVELAFSPDGSWLQARTVWRSAQWPVMAEPRGDAELDTLLAGLGPSDDNPVQLAIPSSRQRAALRARDPGPWSELPAPPTPVVAGRAALDGSVIPERAPGTPDALLDLTRFYTVGPYTTRSSARTPRPFLRPVPAGVQRMDGTDFDLRGMVEVGDAGLGGCVPTPPGQPVAAIHALLLPTVRTTQPGQRKIAELVLHYADGGQHTVPIRTGREVRGYDDDSAVRQPFGGRGPLAAIGLRAMTLAGPRLANPQPQRALRCIDLRTTGDPMLVLGLTAEQVQPTRTAAVTSRGNSR